MKFLYGQEGFLINQEVKLLVRELKTEPIIYSDGEPLDDILLDVSTASMFSENKLLIIKDHPALSTSNKETQNFIDGIRNNEDTKIIFTLESEKIDKKNLLIKYLLEFAEIKEFKTIEHKSIVSTIKQLVLEKGGTIDNFASIKLANKLPADLRIIVMEVEKLLLESVDITSKMVDTSIGEYIKDDYFALSNALTSRDAHGIISAYNKKKKAGVEVTMMISQISSSLSLALKVFAYRKQGFSNMEISEKTKIHIFRIKKTGELLSSSNVYGIKNLVISLAKLEGDIKTSKVDPNNGIETFLLKIIR